MENKRKTRKRQFTWHTVSLAARSPETRSQLKENLRKSGSLVEACVMTEDSLEFVNTKLAKEERERIREIRRIGEGAG